MKIRLPWPRKISWKLTLIYALMFSGVLLALSAGVLYGLKYYLLQETNELVQQNASSIADKLQQRVKDGKDLLDSDLLGNAQTDSDTNVIIAEPDGRVVNSSDNYTIENNNITSHPGEMRQAASGKMRLLILNTRVDANGKTAAYLQVAVNMSDNYSFMKLLFGLLAVADSLGIIISVFVGYAVSRRLLTPIDRMTKAATSIGINDLDRRIPVGDAEDEISRLAVAFNGMIERLKVSVDRQTQFVSDASHELRTPISVIQGYINLIDRWGKENRNVLQESIDVIKHETSGMRDLVERLLFLARTDCGQMKAKMETFDLGELLHETAEETRLIYPGSALAVETSGTLTLKADRNMIKQVLRNLLDNAVKFTQGEGHITLGGTHGNRGIAVSVSDDGTGIPEAELGHIFDRFYRVDKARSKDTGGSGLGLAIVKSIVDIHGGKIEIKSAAGRGTSITIILPES